MVSRVVRPGHRDTLHPGTVPMLLHPPYCILARSIHACFHRHAASRRERVARLQQPIEPRACILPAPGCSELHVTRLFATLRTRPVHTNGETIQLTLRVRQQHLTRTVRCRTAYLAREIQSLLQLASQTRALLDRSLALALCQLRQPDHAIAVRTRRRVRRFVIHQQREVLRPIPELLVQPHMFRTVRKCEKSRPLHAPCIELLHRCIEQLLRHPLVPVLREHRKRPEEPERSPPRQQVRADQPLPVSRRQRFHVLALDTRSQHVAIAQERHRIRQPNKGPERRPHDAVRFLRLALFQPAHTNSRSLRNHVRSFVQACAERRQSRRSRLTHTSLRVTRKSYVPRSIIVYTLTVPGQGYISANQRSEAHLCTSFLVSPCSSSLPRISPRP